MLRTTLGADFQEPGRRRRKRLRANDPPPHGLGRGRPTSVVVGMRARTPPPTTLVVGAQARARTSGFRSHGRGHGGREDEDNGVFHWVCAPTTKVVGSEEKGTATDWAWLASRSFAKVASGMEWFCSVAGANASLRRRPQENPHPRQTLGFGMTRPCSNLPSWLCSSMIWKCRNFHLPLDGCPLVMGIVNVTPDSFSDGGRYAGAKDAIAHCDQLLAQGAHSLALGGGARRPGRPPLPAGADLAPLPPRVPAWRAPSWGARAS